MNLQQVRVIDPVLTNIAIGYQNAEFVGHHLFPRANVQVSGGQVIEFGKEAFRKYNLRRAPGAHTVQIQFGYAGKKFALVQDAVEAVVPREWLRDAAAVPGIALGQRAVQLGLDVVQLALENEQAALATDAANYGSDNKVTLTSSSWYDPDRNPITDIATAQEAVGDGIGRDANLLVLSGSAFAALRSNPHILERFKGLSAGAVSREQLQQVLDVERIVVGRARNEATDGSTVRSWGQHAVLAYAAPANSSVEQPSFGFTYTMEGHPLVEQPYYDNSRKSWVYPVTYERSPELTGVAAGYLFTDAGAAL